MERTIKVAQRDRILGLAQEIDVDMGTETIQAYLREIIKESYKALRDINKSNI